MMDSFCNFCPSPHPQKSNAVLGSSTAEVPDLRVMKMIGFVLCALSAATQLQGGVTPVQKVPRSHSLIATQGSLHGTDW